MVFPEIITLQLLSYLPPRASRRGRPPAGRARGRRTRPVPGLGRHATTSTSSPGATTPRRTAAPSQRVLPVPPRRLDRERQLKLHITPNERRWWGVRPGDAVNVFDTDRGRVAISICYDVEFPEVARIAAMQGRADPVRPVLHRQPAGLPARPAVRAGPRHREPDVRRHGGRDGPDPERREHGHQLRAVRPSSRRPTSRSRATAWPPSASPTSRRSWSRTWTSSCSRQNRLVGHGPPVARPPAGPLRGRREDADRPPADASPRPHLPRRDRLTPSASGPRPWAGSPGGACER